MVNDNFKINKILNTRFSFVAKGLRSSIIVSVKWFLVDLSKSWLCRWFVGEFLKAFHKTLNGHLAAALFPRQARKEILHYAQNYQRTSKHQKIILCKFCNYLAHAQHVLHLSQIENFDLTPPLRKNLEEPSGSANHRALSFHFYP